MEPTDAPAIEVGRSVPVSVPRRVGRSLVDEERTMAAAVRRWGAIAALALVFATIILAWSAVQLSGRGRAERILSEALAPLTEIDALLDAEYGELVAEAAVSRGAVTVPHYPLAVTIQARELAALSQAELRGRVLAESAGQVYEEGIRVFRREPGGSGGLFSDREVARLTMGQLTQDNHRLAKILSGALLAALIPLAAAVALLSRGPQRLGNLGLALTLAAAPLTVAALGLHFGLRFAADGAEDPFNAALLEIGAEVSWVPLWNFTIFAVLGLLAVALARGLEVREGRQAGREGWAGGEEGQR